MSSVGSLRVLLVDDDEDVRDAIATGLRLAGYDVVEAADGRRALALLDNDSVGAIVSDIRMPLLDGRQLLQRVKGIDPELPVILVTGHGDIEQAVDAVRQGAYDFLTKPFASDRLADAVARAIELRRLVLENRHLRVAVASARDRRPSPLIGSSPAVSILMRVVEQIGSASIDIVIEGERGTGKRAIAELLHRAAGGHHGGLRPISCDVMTERAINDVLSGERIAHGGRSKTARPAADATRQSTLILDNVESLSPTLQARLLHYLDQHSRDDHRSGSSAIERRPRIISTTSCSLSSQVNRGLFRADLYYKLAPVKLEVPPLRARKQDIPALFAHLLDLAANRFDRPVPTMSDAVLAHLTNHDWPGNMRELQNFAEQVVLNLEKAEFALDAENLGLAERVAIFEKEAIIAALHDVSGDIQQSCAKLRIPRKTLYDKIARYRIDLKKIRASE